MATSKQRTFTDLQAEIVALQKKASELRDREVAEVIDRIKKAIASYGLSAADLGLKATGTRRVLAAATPAAPTAKPSRKAGKKTGKIAPKYRDDAGNTWSGRGLKPRWLTAELKAGRRIEDFVI